MKIFHISAAGRFTVDQQRHLSRNAIKVIQGQRHARATG